ncbi:hypothetical protein VNI00_001561 [Paramarasmius palmivorus]|uniref:Lysosomal dipeptide transporter MFSD1 n=1 Tax=Paramarasmius palmivorus TaxID=297713 RepID=A0AAW0E2H8_9AGAR
MARSNNLDAPTRHDHRRHSCDDLLAEPYDSERDERPLDEQGLLGRRSEEDRAEELEAEIVRRRQQDSASYILGPLKSRLSKELGASHTEFGLLFSAFSLNSTWTPLLGGIMASSLGTTFTSIFATGIVLTGQLLLLLGEVWGNIRLMTFGLFIFGLGISPLAVVQETIIVRFFKSHGLGVSMAFGLLAGKGASFVSARTSYPLTERFGSHAPFYVATILAAMSFFVNLAYIAASKWLVDGAHAELEAADISEEARRRSTINMTESQALEKVAAKKRVNLREITKLGDVFWAYVALNVFCGMIWAPFTHLASNIIETRYNMEEEDAANTASFLLVGSIFLYPICGFLVDRYKHRPIVVQLLLLSSTLTGLAYIWLALPTQWTGTPIPAILSFAFGHGFAPLLLVVLVPKIVSLKYVSTALGVHKSLEQTGTVIFQTLAGFTLDTHNKNAGRNSKEAAQRLLYIWVGLNIVQFISILCLAWLQRRKDKAKEAAARRSRSVSRSPSNHRMSTTSDHQPLMESEHSRYSSTGSRIRRSLRDEAQMKGEMRRGEVFATLSTMLIIFAWVLFMGTAYFRLGMKKHD